ncbi:hypothetical protein ACEE08_10685, partial [Staphylococcus rostri]
LSKDYKRQIAELCAERVKLNSENSRLLKTVAKLSDERNQYKRERDELINDIAVVRDQRDEYKDKLDEVVDLFVGHINYKLSVSHNQWYINLRHKLDRILHSEKENG